MDGNVDLTGSNNCNIGNDRVDYHCMSKEDAIALINSIAEDYMQRLKEKEKTNDLLTMENKLLVEKCRHADEQIEYLTNRITHFTEIVLGALVDKAHDK